MTENNARYELRVICLDVGDKRVGVAVSDPTGTVALPVKVLNRVSLETDLKSISELVSHYKAKTLVIGDPKHLSGKSSNQSMIIDEFIAKVEPRLQIKVERWDERLTSVSAEKDLISLGVKRRSRRRVIDAAAATLILQSYLDSKRAK